jgi:mannose-6-phosphate isomerase-like protein (cupin superfamily)
MHEAKIEDTPAGRLPADDGWFILNLDEIGWRTIPGNGTWCVFESPNARSTMLGIGVHVLAPGEPPGMYHREPDQEGFLVIAGECLAIVEGEERRMRTWDYLHCPPNTEHITIGAGDEPCAILMVGTRTSDDPGFYPAEPLAARFGAASSVPTADPKVAYEGRPPSEPARSPWPLTAPA